MEMTPPLLLKKEKKKVKKLLVVWKNSRQKTAPIKARKLVVPSAPKRETPKEARRKMDIIIESIPSSSIQHPKHGHIDLLTS